MKSPRGRAEGFADTGLGALPGASPCLSASPTCQTATCIPRVGSACENVRSTLPLALSVLMLITSSVHAGIGETGGQILMQPLGARPAALGEATSAEGGTTDALAANPAGLAGLVRPEGSALFHAGFAGDTFVSVLGGGSIKGFGVGGAVAYQTSGSVERIDPTGRSAQVAAMSELWATAGLARALPVVPVSIGGSLEIIRSTLLEEFVATDVAANLGIHCDIDSIGLALGAAVQHWGGDLRYDEEKLPIDINALPLSYRFGAAWTTMPVSDDMTIGRLERGDAPALQRRVDPHGITLFGEAVVRRAEHAVAYGGGVEYGWAGWAFLRGGYRRLAEGAARTRNLYSFGVGVRRGPIRVDYAIELLEFTALHRVGLTIAQREEPEERSTR